MKISRFIMAFVVVMVLVAPLLAHDVKLNGPHYNLNIIGMEKAKNPDMTNSDRHTIFVALGSKTNAVATNIYLKPGSDFQVCDGNGFDAAYDCDGSQIKGNLGATFQMPCNTSLTYDLDLGCPVDVAQR